ncbi:amidohydrolase family protein [Sphingomonas aerophila]|uniref:Putative TIM-barrel fold metal-dependent hydrolase n=1 Tax=Sphingomonas aerophila TaxID=1344948 RepID=A0A7W9BGF5_9SPHN|nr:amidohydrolase family protein [Sphingomonas aerophila]MBB5716727.1 putative TIM-barrel fold metal-dependent hydrolase [Sphingomonas aerophila]
MTPGGVPFVDAHVHLWDLSRHRYAWLTPPFADDGPNGNVSTIAATYLAADYAREAANWPVAGYVHVEAGADATQALDETSWLESLDDGPAGIVAFAALDHPDLDRLLRAQSAHRRVRGVRHIVNWHRDSRRTYTPRDVTGDEGWQRGFSMLADHNLSFDCQAYPGQFRRLASLFDRHPDIPVIVNHAGMGVEIDAQGAAEWRDGMIALAALPHVAVKISGLGFVWRPMDRSAALGRVRETIDFFGADRVLVASDFPTDRLFGSFDDVLGLIAEATVDLSDADRRAVWGGNANRLYRLGLSI